MARNISGDRSSEDSVEYGVSLSPIEFEVAKIIEIHTGETGENFGFAGIECVGVNGARGGKNAVQHVEKISGSIGFHVGAEPEKTA